MADAERRLAAIMFTDIVGYTSLAQRNEALAFTLLEQHRTRLRPFFSSHNGREIKTMGDAFLVEFGSALEAVRCGFDIQQSLYERNSALPAEERVMLRIGIHVGDVIQVGGDVYGDAVNVASRIELLTEPGGICITEQVYDQVRNKFEFPIVTLGKRELKNVRVPLEIFKLVLPWEKSSAEVTALDRHRIAVLPFASMISDPSDEYFADGMTEELISTISKIQGLRVISRTSVMKYREGNKSTGEIGEELKVGTVLEGSVRKAEKRLRIAVQLIDTRTDEHIWSESYDRELADVFAIQNEIAQSVAEALKVRLLSQDKDRIERVPTADMEAYTLYLKGRFYASRLTEEGLKKSIECYRQAIGKDPRYALAYAGLSRSYSSLWFQGYLPSREAFPKAEEFATEALELDDSLAEAHLSTSMVLIDGWDWSSAEREIKRALELDPNLASGHLSYAFFLLHVGRPEEAVLKVRHALELDPLSAETNARAGTVYLYADHYDEAIEQFNYALEIDPNNSHAQNNLGLAYVKKGMFEEGIAEIDKAISLTKGKNPLVKADLAYAYKKAGRMDEAGKILDDLKDRLERGGGSATTVAGVYAIMEDKEKAFEWLDRAYEEHLGILPSIKNEVWFESIRSDPRFLELLKKMGLK